MNSLAAVTGCLIWFPIAFWAVSLVQWWIAGEIDAIGAILGLFVVVELGVVAVYPKDPRLAPLSFGTVVIGTIAFPFVRETMRRRELRSIDRDALEKAYDSLGNRPLDPLARFRVAEIAWDLGLAGPAARIADLAIKGMDPGMFRSEIARAKGWLVAVGRRPDLQRDLACPKCRAKVPLPEPFCPSCGAPYLLLRAGGAAGKSPLARRMFGGWLGLLSLVAAAPIVGALPGPWAPLGIVGALVLAVAILVWTLRGGE